MSRYNGRGRAVNDSEMYEDIFELRGIQRMVQYTTPKLNYPDNEDFNRIRTVEYVWKSGDKFWRLSAKHYGDPKKWWVIAQFNQKPTEGHLSEGDTIQIPLDLSVALGVLT